MEFFKFVDKDGYSYTATEDFTGKYPELLKRLNINHDEVAFDAPIPRSLNPEEKRASIDDEYSITKATHRRTGEFLFTLYKGQNKKTIIKAALNDKSKQRNLATVAKRSRKSR